LKKIQRRATKLVHGFNKNVIRTKIESTRTTLITTKKTRDLIETYKILTDKEKINSDQLFQKATTSLPN